MVLYSKHSMSSKFIEARNNLRIAGRVRRSLMDYFGIWLSFNSPLLVMAMRYCVQVPFEVCVDPRIEMVRLPGGGVRPGSGYGFFPK